MKNNHFLFVFLLVIFIFIMAVLLTPTPTNWTFTFSAYDKNPHGSFVLFEELDQIFPSSTIEISDSTEYQVARNWKKDSTSLIIITNSYYSHGVSTDNRLDSFVYQGNHVFISANYINFSRQDSSDMGKIRLFTKYPDFKYQAGMRNGAYKDVEFTTGLVGNEDTTLYTIRGEYVSGGMRLRDSAKVLQLGTLQHADIFEQKEVNFLRIPHGKGSYFLHTNPGVFTNNAMLHDSLSNYASAVLSHLPESNHILWDEHNKPGLFFLNQISRKRVSAWTFIKQNPALHFAMWLTIIGSLVLIFTKGKREQQAIPVIAPPKNQSVEFAKTMGRFYYEKAQHIDIAKKRMAYFELDVRKKYNIHNIDNYQNKQKELSHITGIEEDVVKEFFKKRDLLDRVEQLTEKQLQSVSKSIEQMQSKSSKKS